MGEARHYKPTYHAYIPKGWCNDPNGMIYYNGTNHLYFQHYPYNAAWGTMPQVTRPATNNAADFLDNFFIEFLPFQVRY